MSAKPVRRPKYIFIRKETCYISKVKVNASDNSDFGIIRRDCTIYCFIATYIRTNPIGGEVASVRVDDSFSCMEGNISLV